MTLTVSPSFPLPSFHPLSLPCGQAKASKYRSWRAFVDDFILIVTNALEYNPKRSRVYKSALKFYE